MAATTRIFPIALAIGMTATFSVKARATCPAPAGYGTATPPEYRFRPSDQLPAPTDTTVMVGSCADPSPPTWCADVIASAPHPLGAAQRDHLFVWFAGVNNQPSNVDFVPKLAAFAGYRTVNLPWDNYDKPRFRWCEVDDNGTTLLGGYCDDGCMFTLAQEMLDGVDMPSTDYIAVPERSITVRLAMALEHLYKDDVNQDGFDDKEWASFCNYDPNTDTTSIVWEDVEVGGFSMGANIASYISYTAQGVPTGESIGLLAVDAGADLCESTGDEATLDPSEDYYVDEYDDPSIPPCGGTACSDHNRFLFAHNEGLVTPTLPYSDTMLEQVGIGPTLTDLDALISGGFPLDFEDPAAPGTYRNLLNTSVNLAGCNGHLTVGTDACAPTAFSSGTPVDQLAGENASDAYLAPAWMSALCQLDSP